MLTQEVQDLIAKNLPAIAASELQKYLMQTAGFETQNKTLLEEVRAWKQTANERDVELATAKASIADLQAREKRSQDLDARLLGFELECARLRLAAAEDKAKVIISLAEIAFRNPRLVHTETMTGRSPCPTPAGGYASSTDVAYKIERTTEETK